MMGFQVAMQSVEVGWPSLNSPLPIAVLKNSTKVESKHSVQQENMQRSKIKTDLS